MSLICMIISNVSYRLCNGEPWWTKSKNAEWKIRGTMSESVSSKTWNKLRNRCHQIGSITTLSIWTALGSSPRGASARCRCIHDTDGNQCSESIYAEPFRTGFYSLFSHNRTTTGNSHPGLREEIKFLQQPMGFGIEVKNRANNDECSEKSTNDKPWQTIYSLLRHQWFPIPVHHWTLLCVMQHCAVQWAKSHSHTGWEKTTTTIQRVVEVGETSWDSSAVQPWIPTKKEPV